MTDAPTASSGGSDGPEGFNPTGLKVRRAGRCSALGRPLAAPPPPDRASSASMPSGRPRQRRQPARQPPQLQAPLPAPFAPPPRRCSWWMTTPCASKWCPPCCSAATTKVGCGSEPQRRRGCRRARQLRPLLVPAYFAQCPSLAALCWLVCRRPASNSWVCIPALPAPLTAGPCRNTCPVQWTRALAARRHSRCCGSGKSSTTSSTWCSQTCTCLVRPQLWTWLAAGPRRPHPVQRIPARQSSVQRAPYLAATLCLPFRAQIWTGSSCWSTLAWSWTCQSSVSCCGAAEAAAVGWQLPVRPHLNALQRRKWHCCCCLHQNAGALPDPCHAAHRCHCQPTAACCCCGWCSDVLQWRHQCGAARRDSRCSRLPYQGKRTGWVNGGWPAAAVAGLLRLIERLPLGWHESGMQLMPAVAASMHDMSLWHASLLPCCLPS